MIVALRAAWVAGCALLAGFAVAAALGFVHPVLDLFNHLQPLLLSGLIAVLVLSALMIRAEPWRALVLTIAATGVVASSMIYIPEAVRGWNAGMDEQTPDSTVYRLVTFNVFGRNERPELILDTLDTIDPDIVALQEYSPQVRRAIHTELTERFDHFQYCVGGQRAFVGLYSKLAFEPLSQDACSASAVSTDRTARIMVRFDPEASRAFSLATTHNDWPAPITRQTAQFAALADALVGTPDPIIMVGDFNSTPWSYALRGFVDTAGLRRHTYNRPTFPALWHYLGAWRPALPILPIDHVLTRGGLSVHSIDTAAPSASDHLPIVVTFSVPAS
ncbi:endonuclease/exonuclease/phosphatase family protein [Pelagibacterium montanilacus]|uniref:endonuclease/exonuclease/phosphatase family protein n=1 Tax=Pelagibacterium montanilacus TaxID=2185280 RepID=UPI0013DF3114|nr:endonuclease/exonuclease/phosphatase family protein [Pelagibacterium montanilacus]